MTLTNNGANRYHTTMYFYFSNKYALINLISLSLSLTHSLLSNLFLNPNFRVGATASLGYVSMSASLSGLLLGAFASPWSPVPGVLLLRRGFLFAPGQVDGIFPLANSFTVLANPSMIATSFYPPGASYVITMLHP